MTEHWTDCGDCGWHLKVPEAFKPGWVMCVKYGHETHVHGGCVWGKDVEPVGGKDKEPVGGDGMMSHAAENSAARHQHGVRHGVRPRLSARFGKLRATTPYVVAGGR